MSAGPRVPSTDDLSAALEVLLQDADIWRSKALITGCELDIFGVLDRAAAGALWVAEAVGAAPEPAARLLSALHEMGYLQSENGVYRNAPVSATFLVPGKPHYLGSWIRLQGTDWEALGGLTDIVRTGQPPRQGSAFQDPARLRTLLQAAHDRGRIFQIHRLLQELDLTGIGTLIDVGGGAGTYSLAFCQAYPDLECTIFDLPAAIEVARETTAPYGLASRIHFRAGNFSQDSLGGPFDAAFLSSVLHGEGPAGAIALLKRCYAALRPGGQIIIRDSFLDRDGINEGGGAVFSLALMIETLEGRTYKLAEIEKMLRSVGFQDSSRLTEQVLVARVPA